MQNTMDKDVIIKVENLGKKFTKSLKRSLVYGTTDVARNMFGIPSKTTELRKGEFWSLKGVSFEVKKGEALGVIGQNGSGKTTMLRVLNGIFPPDEGKVWIKGRLGALIAIGAGFQPQMTGRENIYLNGTILGMTRKELDQKMQQIIDFADIGDFLDAPVATYSSGMTVRLGFAVMIHSEPEIILADEGLGVGDLAFVLKCYRKIAEFRRNGGTIILVSHGMSLIRNNCQKVLWLDHGEPRMYGNTQEVCDAYEGYMMQKDAKTDTDDGSIINNDPLTKITGVDILDKDLKVQEQYNAGEPLTIRIHYDVKRVVEKPVFSVTIYNPENYVPICNFTVMDKYEFDKVDGVGYIDFKLDKLVLKASEYRISITFTENNDINNILEWHEKTYRFIVAPNGIVTYGAYNPFPKWELHQGE